MAKIVDEAIGSLPENIQRELNDAWASGKSSPYTRAVDPLNATLLYRAQTIRGMQMEIAALKAQRDELLVALTYASKVYRAHGIPTEKIEVTLARYNPLFIDGAEHDPLCLKVCRSPLKQCNCGAARATEGSAT